MLWNAADVEVYVAQHFKKKRVPFIDPCSFLFNAVAVLLLLLMLLLRLLLILLWGLQNASPNLLKKLRPASG